MDARIGIEELQQHAAALNRLALRVAHDGPAADDLVQDTWLRALVQPPQSSVRSLRAWLGTVLRNRNREVLRSQSIQREHESAAARPDHVEQDFGDVEERLRLQSALARALHELPEPLRAAVTLRYLDEHPGPEVARMLGVSHDALRQRLSRGLALLRERLDRDLGPRGAWMLVALRPPSRHVPTIPPPILAATVMTTTTKFLVAGIAIVLAVAAIVVWVRVDPLGASRGHAVAQPDVGSDASAEPLAPAAQSTPPRASVESAPSETASTPAVDREHDLFGLVLGPDEKPVAGATVRVMRNESSGWHVDDVGEYDRYVPIASSITRVDGGFAIPLDRGRAYSLFVDAAGLAPAHLGLRNAGERVVVHLGPAGAVDVHVLRSDGSPLAAGRVSITSAPDGASDESWRICRMELDADGRAHVSDLPCENLGIEVAPADESWPLWADVTVVANAVTPVEIVLPKGDEVRGRVVDARTHLGVAGARIGAPKWFGRGVLTDLDGAFVIPALSPDFGLVHVDAPGYAHASVNARDDKDGMVSPLVIELHAGRSVSGRVVDSGGAPVPGAYVAATGSAWRDRYMQHDWIGTRSDEHGLFRIVDLDPELGHTLVARKDGFGAATFDLPAYEADSDSVKVGDLVLTPPSIVSGRVIDTSGAPIADLRVELSGSSADRAILPGAVHPLIDPGTEARHVRTDDIGRFTFADVAAGTYALRVPGDEGHTPTAPLALEVSSGQERAGIEIVCEVALSIRGRATGPDGHPIAVIVRAVPVGPHERGNGAVSDDDGVFVVRGVIAGPHDLVVEPRDPTSAAPISLRVDAGAPEIRVRLPDLEFVRGRILDEAGQPCAKAWVQLVDTRCDQAMTSTQSAADGTFELGIARGATWELEAISRKLTDGTKLRAKVPDVAARDGLDVVVRRTP